MKRRYPYYGKSKHNGVIVYFTNLNTGTIIDNGSCKEDEPPEWVSLGAWGDVWREFEAFNEITDPNKIKNLDKKRLLLNL